MQAQVIDKATGASTQVSVDRIALRAPSVVKLDIDRAQVASMERQGNDLIVRLADGQEIRVAGFYGEPGAAAHELVLQEQDSTQWLAQVQGGVVRYTPIHDLEELGVAAVAAGGGGSSLLLPGLLGLGLAGGAAAAAGGGGSGGGSGGGTGANPGTDTGTGPGTGGNTGGGMMPGNNDTTPPDAPSVTVAGTGTAVTGTGEPGATIRVTTPEGAVIGTGTVPVDGRFTVPLIPPQADGGTIVVVQADAAGNVSPPVTLAAPDITAPSAPTLAVAADGIAATGTGEPGATLTITNAAGAVVGRVEVGANGGYALSLSPPQIDGGTLTARQADDAGNVSPAATATAPDYIAPAAPVAAIDATGAVVSGTGEAGAAIRIVAVADGSVIGTGTVGADGRYSVTLATPQRDSQALAVTQTDAGGNPSPATGLTAPDLIAPAAPSATIDATGTIIGGGAEPGATITVRDGTATVVGTATANAQGDFAIVLTVPQLDAQTLTVTQADEAGNVSPATTLVAPDLTAPPAPVATVAADGGAVTGTGEPGATVTVTDPFGRVIGTAPVGAAGTYAVGLSPAQTDGEVLTVRQADGAGNVSPAATAAAPDLVADTAPEAPTAAVAADGGTVSGQALAGAAITVVAAGGTVIGTGVAAADGRYTVALSQPQTNGETVRVTQTDTIGQASPPATALAPDLTAPAAPTATLDGTGSIVTGTGEPLATITVTAADGSMLGTATVNARGGYAVSLSEPQVDGETLSVRQTDQANNISPPIALVAPDLTAPPAPIATVAADGTAVTGTGEAGARVTVIDATGTVLGTATVAPDGRYSVALVPAQANGQPLDVTQADAAGNVSPATDVTAPDITAPLAPTIAISADGTVASGSGETGAAITVTGPGGAVLGNAVVTAAGSWSVVLAAPQINGEVLTASQRDVAGNPSLPATATAPDFVAPAAPAGIVSPDGATVIGTGEAGARIVITDPAGAPIGVATVAADGSFSAALNVRQVDGQVLGIVQTDPAGNPSPPASATAPDLTAPAAPAGTVAGDGGSVTGTGEPGARITVTAPGGAVIGTATVAGDGSFTAPLTPAQRNGETLGLAQADPANNPSPQVAVVAPDLVVPVAPTATIAPDGTSVSGTGQAGATVTVTGAGGAAVGSAIVGGDGNYAVALTPVQNNGQALSVTQADAAGASPSIPLTAPDLVAPAAPTGTVSADGATVTGRGEAGARVTITTAGGVSLGSADVAADGTYSVTLGTSQRNGEVLGVVQADAVGNRSPVTPAVAPDLTAPGAPVATVAPNGTLVTGTGEPGATVVVRDATTAVVGTAVVTAGGGYVVTLAAPVLNGEVLTVTQRDPAGNLSAATTAIGPDTTAPNIPTAVISGDGAVVSGTGVAGSTITVRDPDGTAIGTALVAGDGSYAATLTPAQRDGELLSVTQADAGNNISPAVPVLAPDLTAPAAPAAIISADGTVVSGTGEPGAQVRVTGPGNVALGTAEVGANGSYVVTLTPAQANGQPLVVVQADDAGNVSLPAAVTAPDITPPAAPAALAVTADGGVVTGTGEPGARVEVRGPGGAVIGTGLVDGNGGFAVAIAPAQTTAATLALTQTDAAGNRSPVATVVAPFDIEAFGNSATVGIDLVPATSAVTLGGANYVALVSLGALNLQAEVLTTPAVRFTVEAGRSLDATFTYDAVLNVGALSGYAVVVQRFDGTSWVAVNAGGGGGPLLELGLLGGNLVGTEVLGPGEYRAFATFQGAAGVGLLGDLKVTGVQTDFTDVTGVVPATVQGNVITDAGPGGQVDLASAQTSVQSVTVNGVTTAIVTDDTVVQGAWGRLTIDRDGSYSYTPSADATAIGRADVFRYTLVDGSDGELSSADLTIGITSPDITGPAVAANDSDVATVRFENVTATIAPAVDFSFATPGALLVPQTRSGSDSFTVAAGSTSDVTITAVRTGLLSVLPSYTITVRDGQGSVVGAATQTAVAGLPLGTATSLTLQDLPAGSYTYTVSSTNSIGTGYSTTVYLGQSITYDEYRVAQTTVAEGNLLANDDIGGSFAAIRLGSGGAFTEIGDAGLTVAGRYGTLTVSEAGDYVYRPGTTIAYSPTDLVDSFTYELVQPNGAVSTATLNVTLDVPGDGAFVASATPTLLSLSVAAAVPLDGIESVTADAGPTAHDVQLGAFTYAMFEGQGEVEVVLDRYLAEIADGGVSAPATVTVDAIAPPVAAEAGQFDYLVMVGDLQHEQMHHASAI